MIKHYFECHPEEKHPDEYITSNDETAVIHSKALSIEKMSYKIAPKCASINDKIHSSNDQENKTNNKPNSKMHAAKKCSRSNVKQFESPIRKRPRIVEPLTFHFAVYFFFRFVL